MGVSVEPEGGFEPPTCRLRGRRISAIEGQTHESAQLRRSERQGNDAYVKAGSLTASLPSRASTAASPRAGRSSQVSRTRIVWSAVVRYPACHASPTGGGTSEDGA